MDFIPRTLPMIVFFVISVPCPDLLWPSSLVFLCSPPWSALYFSQINPCSVNTSDYYGLLWFNYSHPSCLTRECSWQSRSLNISWSPPCCTSARLVSASPGMFVWRMLSSWWQLEEGDPVCNSHPAGPNQSQIRLCWGAHLDNLSAAIRVLTLDLGNLDPPPTPSPQHLLKPVSSHPITCCRLLGCNWGKGKAVVLIFSLLKVVILGK